MPPTAKDVLGTINDRFYDQRPGNLIPSLVDTVGPKRDMTQLTDAETRAQFAKRFPGQSFEAATNYFRTAPNAFDYTGQGGQQWQIDQRLNEYAMPQERPPEQIPSIQPQAPPLNVATPAANTPALAGLQQAAPPPTYSQPDMQTQAGPQQSMSPEQPGPPQMDRRMNPALQGLMQSQRRRLY